MTSRELVAVMKAPCAGCRSSVPTWWIVAPAYDSGDVTAVAGANLAYELVTLMADNA